MEKIRVEICLGTACYLLGATKLVAFTENPPADLADKIEIEATTCLGMCNDDRLGGAPYVRINGTETMSNATPARLESRLREMLGLDTEGFMQ